MEAISKVIRFLLFFILLLWAMYYGQEVLVPFCFAGLLAMLFLPFSRWMESKGINRGFASVACILTLLLVISLLLYLLAWQLSDLSKEFTGIEQKIKGFIDETRQYIRKSFGISLEQQKKMINQQGSQGSSKIAGFMSSFMGSMFSVLVNFILTLVYIFLLLYFRSHIHRFILKIVAPEDQQRAKTIMNKASGVAQKYLTGLALMIVSLWILYSIGFSIVGVKHAIFFAILCGMLEIVPFVGNITGTSITVIVSLAQGGDINLVIGILVVYGLVQFIQTYILEPLVVGAEVNINPLFTILVIVVGEALWGIAGMVLAIPLLGIVKIICDHIEPLKPYGFLIGGEKKKKSSSFLGRFKK